MKELYERTSIRSFLDRPVEADNVERLLRAAMCAPSAGNQQPWEFVVVDDRFLIDALRDMSSYTGALKTAPLAIVVCGRTKNLRFPHDTPSDLSAATENILLEAVHLGLGACWLGTAPDAARMAAVKRTLRLPDGLEAYSVLAIGYPNELKEPEDRFEQERIHHNRF